MSYSVEVMSTTPSGTAEHDLISVAGTDDRGNPFMATYPAAEYSAPGDDLDRPDQVLGVPSVEVAIKNMRRSYEVDPPFKSEDLSRTVLQNHLIDYLHDQNN